MSTGGTDAADTLRSGADLTGALLAGAVLRRASLAHARVGSVRIPGASGGGRDQATVLIGADIRSADLRGIELAKCVLE